MLRVDSLLLILLRVPWASSVFGWAAVVNSGKLLAIIISNIYSTSSLLDALWGIPLCTGYIFQKCPKVFGYSAFFWFHFFSLYFNLRRFLLSVFKLADSLSGGVQSTYGPMKGSLHFRCSACLFLAFSPNESFEFWSVLRDLFLHIVYFFH